MVVVRKGCTVIIRVRLRIFDLYKSFDGILWEVWVCEFFEKRSQKSYLWSLK